MADAVARLYIESVGEAPARFVTQVTAAGLIPKPACQLVFDAEGNSLGTLEEVAARSREAR